MKQILQRSGCAGVLAGAILAGTFLVRSCHYSEKKYVVPLSDYPNIRQEYYQKNPLTSPARDSQTRVIDRYSLLTEDEMELYNLDTQKYYEFDFERDGDWFYGKRE